MYEAKADKYRGIRFQSSLATLVIMTLVPGLAAPILLSQNPRSFYQKIKKASTNWMDATLELSRYYVHHDWNNTSRYASCYSAPALYLAASQAQEQHHTSTSFLFLPASSAASTKRLRSPLISHIPRNIPSLRIISSHGASNSTTRPLSSTRTLS